MIGAGCITEIGNTDIALKNVDISEIYSTFNAPHSLEINLVNEESNLTKIVYTNSEHDTVILTIQPDTNKPINTNTLIKMNEIDVHFVRQDAFYVYIWIIDSHRFSIVGTDETISYDFVKEMIAYTLDYLIV
ncbi:MAG: hypothetical protein M8353_11155 [ANME-2 cluster archaeon]|nr:hypothetical protein [ANME-2 cluster archaeon]